MSILSWIFVILTLFYGYRLIARTDDNRKRQSFFDNFRDKE
jgi:hypothetical protein